ncbi:minor capsid protein [Sporolactobacillus sp. STSJ-5]|uniref:putative minor capsid protein n=1 Tax=Sporolactobacillus sp. STSJ-5 TaxID=2965076 RepID=UPI002107004D|nr:putative minor capsid protein [Sporolactobacillus sp. STSJ-5]MCQ2010548.1 minor capsid protein [Sporolactobacillus sp. STSJ-5]
MSFRKMLIHRCTLHIPGIKTGEDDYGQPIYSNPTEIEDVLCRVHQVHKTVSVDPNGQNYITQYVLFTGPGQELNNAMTVNDLKDKAGNAVLTGSFSLQDAQPIYGRTRLHHYEAVLKGSE